ncbi:TrbI/VirB10 family protein [Thermovirga lienii]|uniref:TrbI/VirB10 family protein n=1 Tax=Thermovirga lienii TaxID=336261 RepID=UPI002FE121F8
MQGFDFESEFRRDDEREHGPMNQGPIDYEEHSDDSHSGAGFVDPSHTQPHFSPQDVKKKRIRIVLIGGIAALLAMGVFGVLTFKDVFLSSKPNKQQETTLLQVSEEEYQQLLKEREELAKRIGLLEQEREQWAREIDRRINNRIEDLMNAMQKQDNSDKQTEAIMRQLQAMQRQLEQLKQSPAAQQPLEPRKGSTASSQILNRVAVWRETQEAIAQEVAKTAEQEPLYSKVQGIQVGTMIDGILETRLVSAQIDTNTEKFYAVITTTQPVQAGQFTLPTGVKFLGRVVSDFDARRIFVELEAMQYRDVTIPVSGVVLDKATGSPGLISKYIDPVNQAAWNLLIPNLLASAAEVAQEMDTRVTNDRYVYETPKYTAENVARQGLARTMTSMSSMLTEAYLRKKPVMLVNANTPVMIQITQTIPLDVLLESGVVQE